MKRRYIGLALGGVLAVGAALSLPSCGHDQKLVSIAVTPATATYLSPNAVAIAFQAMGTYIHPPETKNITQQVTWATDVPAMFILSPVAIVNGEPVEVVAPNGICGIGDLSATTSEGTGGAANIVVGYATLTVDGTQLNCPGSTSGSGSGTLVVTPEGAGTGTVTSSPAGISCPGTACGAEFPSGTEVTLTATPSAGSTFAGWTTGCTSLQGDPNECIVTITGGGLVNAIATFNLQ